LIAIKLLVKAVGFTAFLLLELVTKFAAIELVFASEFGVSGADSCVRTPLDATYSTRF